MSVQVAEKNVIQLLQDGNMFDRLTRRFANMVDTPDAQNAVIAREMYDEGKKQQSQGCRVLAYACFRAAAGELVNHDYGAALKRQFGDDPAITGISSGMYNVSIMMNHSGRGYKVDISPGDILQFAYLEKVRETAARKAAHGNQARLNELFRCILPGLTLA